MCIRTYILSKPHECQIHMTTPWHPRVLVIGPGGTKGLKVLGFLVPIEDENFLSRVDTYCGVSIGAVICLLMVAGYPMRDIVGEAVTLNVLTDMTGFNISDIINNKGFLSNQPVRQRLTKLMVDKFGRVPTLRDLYLLTGKSLVTVTLNATDERCEMMGPATHGNVSCVDATLFSINIPFVFRQMLHHGKAYIDGVFGNPYPVDHFDDGNTNILAIYIKGPRNKDADKLPSRTKILETIDNKTSELTLQSYFGKIFHSLVEQYRAKIIAESSDKCKHIRIEAHTNDTIGTGITTEDKAQMLVEGHKQGKDFLRDVKNGVYDNPQVSVPGKYTYPEYYLREDFTGDTSVLDSMMTGEENSAPVE